MWRIQQHSIPAYFKVLFKHPGSEPNLPMQLKKGTSACSRQVQTLPDFPHAFAGPHSPSHGTHSLTLRRGLQLGRDGVPMRWEGRESPGNTKGTCFPGSDIKEYAPRSVHASKPKAEIKHSAFWCLSYATKQLFCISTLLEVQQLHRSLAEEIL